MIKFADKVDGVYSAFRPEPLQIDELEDFYVDSYKVRGHQNFRARIKRHLLNNPDEHNHLLFIGYKGCGKSTELNYLQKELEERNFLVVNFSVRKQLNPLDFSHIEFVIAIMERLFDEAQKHGLHVSKHFLDKIEHWLSDEEVVKVFTKYNISAEAEAGADGGLGLPYLVKLFGKAKLAFKSSKSLKKTLTQTIEPKIADLLQICNDLLKEIELRIKKKNPDCSLLLIVEDMDKIPRAVSSELFFDYGATLRALQANFIFTFPIVLYHDIRFQTIDANFNGHHVLPMIKIKTKTGEKYKEGVKVIMEIIKRRMNVELFEDIASLEKIICKSGGVLRDLFRMIREAAELALDEGRDRIAAKDVEESIQLLKNDYKNNISDNPENGLKVEDYYRALKEVAENNDPDNTLALLDLRQNLSVLAYNSEGWYDLHPLIRDILTERGELQA